MKTLHLSIIVIAGMMVLSLSLVLPSFAEQPLLDYYNNSELVLVGKVISLSQVSSTIHSSEPNQTRYDIQVEQYYKNPQTAKLITVYGFAKGIYYSSDPTYDVGDRVFLYIDKENGYYQIQPHSLRLHNNCDARPLIPMPSLPFEPPIISMPAFGRLFTFSDSSGNEKTTFAVGEDVNIKFDAENYFPVVNHATVELSVMTENNTKLAFTDKKENITIPACNGNVPVSWSFRPETPGQYSVVVNVTGGLDFDRTEVFYSEPSIGNGFDVRQNTSSVVVEKGPYVSPLKQFKSGISAMDVKCSIGYVLTIKSEDGSPACVRPLTVKILTKVGWSKFESAQSNHATNAKTNPLGIVGLMYYYGGGPCGVGVCPLNTFNLKMNSNYTAYLLGYNICNDNSCITRNNLSILLPLNVIGIPDYKFIALPENTQWKYADVFHIQVEVSSIPDNTTAVWTDLGNSTITH